jgi:hypothetical protein
MLIPLKQERPGHHGDDRADEAVAVIGGSGGGEAALVLLSPQLGGHPFERGANVGLKRARATPACQRAIDKGVQVVEVWR